MTAAMTLTEAAAVLSPPIPRRELARRMEGVAPTGTRYGHGPGRRPATFPVAEILRVHAAWVRENAGRLRDVDGACQNSARQTYVSGRP